jgi:hypothetical protein
MRYDLKAAHDVEAYDPKKGDILEFDPTWSTWKATDALEQLKKRVAALEAAPPPPAPAPGFDLATAKQLIGLGALDTSKDLTITDLLATTQELVEAYLGRKFSGTHTEHFSTSNNFDRVYLKGYPVNTITSVKNMDGDDITYTARKSFGIIKLSQVQSRDSEVEVVYSGGLVVDAPLLRVMWKLFLAFYNADLSTTTGSLSGVSSINIPDVGTITFGGNSGASARYAVLGGNLDPNIAWVLDRYKSEIIGGI